MFPKTKSFNKIDQFLAVIQWYCLKLEVSLFHYLQLQTASKISYYRLNQVINREDKLEIIKRNFT